MCVMHGWTCGCGAVEKLARLQPPSLLLVVPKHDGFHPSAEGRGPTPVMKAGKFGEKKKHSAVFYLLLSEVRPSTSVRERDKKQQTLHHPAATISSSA